jgi:hypothetical protein
LVHCNRFPLSKSSLKSREPDETGVSVLVGVEVCVNVPVGEGVAEGVDVGVPVEVCEAVAVNVGVMVGEVPEGINCVSTVTSSKATSKLRFGPFSPS